MESQVPRLVCKWEPLCVLRLGSCDKLRVRSYGIEGAISVADHLVWSTEESRNDSYNNNKKRMTETDSDFAESLQKTGEFVN